LALQLSRFGGRRSRRLGVAATGLALALPLFVACSSDDPAAPPFTTRTLEDGAVVAEDGAVVPSPLEDGAVPVEPGGDAGGDGGTKPPGDAQVPPVSGAGRVLYRYGGGYKLIEARAGAVPFDVLPKLASVSPGSDARMNMGADGSLVSETTRFGCSTPCLAVYSPTLSAGEKVLPGGAAVREMRDVTPSVAGGGTIIVHGGRGSHSTDLYVTRKTGGAWSASKLLTSASPYANNFKPQISPDGLKVVFDCGSDPYGSSGTNICEVNLDATGFRKVIGPDGGPGGGANTHSPSYDRDGSIVFEGEWTREQVWRIRGTGAPTRVNGTYGNDNTPCLLPNGKIASLWLDRSGNPSGAHELKLMNGDGTGMVMLVTGVDIVDTGLGCGN
jgi:hypothetical protein